MSTDCSAAELELARISSNHYTCLSRMESVALFAASLAPVASFVAVSWLLLRISINVVRYRLKSKRWRLITYPIEMYLLSLFLGDFLESLGDTWNLRSVVVGRVRPGNFCKAQGYILTVGETAVALTTAAIAVHTFFVVWRGRPFSSLVTPRIVVGIIWAFVILCPLILLVSTRERRHEFFTPTPYWCWVNAGFQYKLLTFYAWLWLAMLISFLCYLPLFFWRLGFYISRDPELPWWRFRVRRKPKDDRQPTSSFAYYMILYPIIYFVLGIPLSGARWAQFVSGRSHASTALTTAFIFDLSGLCNCLLFFYTRDGLFLFNSDPPQGAASICGSGSDIETMERREDFL